MTSNIGLKGLVSAALRGYQRYFPETRGKVKLGRRLHTWLSIDSAIATFDNGQCLNVDFNDLIERAVYQYGR